MRVYTVPEFAETVVTVTESQRAVGEICELLRDDDAPWVAVVDGSVLGVLGRDTLATTDAKKVVADILPATAPLVLPHDTTLDDATETFKQHPEQQVIALVEEEGHPVGVVTKHRVVEALTAKVRALSNGLHGANGAPSTVAAASSGTESSPGAEKLPDAEEMLRAITTASPDYIVLCDADHKLQYINRTAEGVNVDDVIGSDVDAWVDPDYRTIVHEKIDEAVRTGATQNFESIAAGKRGIRRWFSVYVCPVVTGKYVGGTMIIGRDVTADKQAALEANANKDKLSSILQITSDQVWEMDLELNLTMLNAPAGATVLGRPIEELNGSSFLSLLLPDDRQVIADNIAEMARQKQGWRNKTFRCLHADGELRYLECNSHPVFDAQGDVVAFRGAIRDVTEIKKAARAIRESEARAQAQLAELDQVYDTAPVGLCVVDRDLRVLRINDRLANIIRMPRSEILGRTLHEVVPRNALVVQPICEQVIATKTPVLDQELRGTPRDGDAEPAHYLASFHPLSDESGDVWACSTVVQDVTDAKRAERELLHRERQHSTAQRIARLGHWDRDLIRNELYWSDEVYRICGVSHDEFGHTPESFLRFVHVDDRTRVLEDVRRALAGERSYHVEYRIVRPSGEIRVVESQGHVIRNDDGEPIRLVGTIQDITERKQIEASLAESEHRYRTMLDSLTEGVVLVDPDGMIRGCNTSATEILHVSREELIGRSSTDPDWDVKSEDGRLLDRECFPAQLTIQTGQPVRDVVVNVLLPDSTRVWLSVNSQPLMRDTTTPPHGAVVSFYDVTQQRRVARELEEQRSRLTHVARVSTMGEMATGIAHELNQPLSAIANYAFSARRIVEQAPREIAEPLDPLLLKLEQQSVRAGEIVRRLRVLVKKSASKRLQADPHEIISETLGLVGPDVRSAGVLIETDFDDQVGAALVDTVQIQQVLLNLILNGVEAMQDTRSENKRLHVSTRAIGIDRIAISVSDRGAGMPAQNVDKVFDAFFTTKQDGLGMGLAISRSIVEDHGGHLTVCPNDDAGVTFQITLPTINEKTSTT